jgi:hypothetical protein
MEPAYPTLAGRYGAHGHHERCICSVRIHYERRSYSARRRYEHCTDRCKHRPAYPTLVHVDRPTLHFISFLVSYKRLRAPSKGIRV